MNKKQYVNWVQVIDETAKAKTPEDLRRIADKLEKAGRDDVAETVRKNAQMMEQGEVK